VELRPEAVLCQAVLGEVSSSLKPLGEAKGLRFETRAPKADLMLDTDRRALTQILLNLTNNAIKFTDRGSVSIELSQEKRPGGLRTSFTWRTRAWASAPRTR
jgi:signal transduction histidine kinase